MTSAILSSPLLKVAIDNIFIFFYVQNNLPVCGVCCYPPLVLYHSVFVYIHKRAQQGKLYMPILDHMTRKETRSGIQNGAVGTILIDYPTTFPIDMIWGHFSFTFNENLNHFQI